MTGSKWLQLAVALSLIVTAFFTGRSSVTVPNIAETIERSGPAPERLSAIIPQDDSSPSEAARKAKAKAKARPAKARPDGEIHANKIAEMFGGRGGVPGDFWELSELVKEWMLDDPDGAIAWLAQGPRRNDILGWMLSLWGNEQPDTALAWLGANTDTDGYDSAAHGLALALRSENAETALGLADTVSDPAVKLQIWQDIGGALHTIDQDELRERLSDSDIPENLHENLLETWETQKRQKSQRNAQNVASVVSAARAAGAEFQATTATELIQEIVAGVNGAGDFQTTRFQIPNLAPQEIKEAVKNLELDEGGSLSYRPHEAGADAP